jgi:hypothetical protein
MHRFFILMLTTLLFTSCKEAIDDAKEDAVIKAMTDGQWKVTNYQKGNTDATSSFSGYSFQFYKNQTVDALMNSAVEKKGTWAGDGTTATIQASFSNATEPLILLNGTWQITRTTWTSVQAFQIVNGEQRVLRLDKQ